MENQIHEGELLKKYFKDNKIRVIDFAENVNVKRTRSWVYDLFKSKKINRRYHLLIQDYLGLSLTDIVQGNNTIVISRLSAEEKNAKILKLESENKELQNKLNFYVEFFKELIKK